MWTIKMKIYLKTLNLWDVVEQGAAHVLPIRENATLNEIKKHKVTKSPKGHLHAFIL